MNIYSYIYTYKLYIYIHINSIRFKKFKMSLVKLKLYSHLPNYTLYFALPFLFNCLLLKKLETHNREAHGELPSKFRG